MPYNFDELNRNAVILNEIFKKYLTIKSEIVAANTEKEKLQRTENESIDKLKNLKERTSKILIKYDSIVAVYAEKFNELRKEGMNIENEYYTMVKECDVMMNKVYEQYVYNFTSTFISKYHLIRIPNLFSYDY